MAPFGHVPEREVQCESRCGGGRRLGRWKMGGGGHKPVDQEKDIEYWRGRALQLADVVHASDGLVYTLKAAPDDRWTVGFVDGTLPVEHPYTTEKVGGSLIQDIIPPDVFATIKPALKGAFLGKRTTYEVEYIPGMWLMGTVKPLRHGQDGSVVEIIASNDDVTARKMAEREREEQRTRLEALVMALPDLVFIFDHDGVFVGYNISHEDDLLVSPSQFIGTSLEDVMPPGVAVEARRVLNVVAMTGVSGEFKYNLTVSGVEQYFHARMVPLADDKVMAVVRNITDLVQAERDERIATAQLDVARRVARLGYWSWDPSTGLMQWSPEVSEMLQILGNVTPAVDELPALIGVDVLARIKAVGFDAMATGGMKQVEFSIDRGNGDVRHFLTSMEMSGETLSSRGMLRGAIQEVTEVRRLEAQLLQSQKMESIGRFAGTMAHDFNNMLQIIRGYAEVLRKVVTGDTQTSGYVDSILAASDKAGDLVNRILTFSRQPNMVKADVVIDDVVRESVRLIEPLIGRAVRLEVSTGCGPTRCSLDRASIEQVLVNLAVNARDAMPEGGTLAIVTAPIPHGIELNESRLTWPWLRDSDFVRIDVADTGTGIPEGILDRIFEPFFTTKGVGAGTGLGLSAAYSIVRRHEGVVYVRETGTHGTTFRIILPVAIPA